MEYRFDVDNTGGVDANGDGVDDALGSAVDTDNDGIFNHLELDSDNDGYDDWIENGDYNNDGTLDRLQKEKDIESARRGAGSVTPLLLAMMLLLFFTRREIKGIRINE